METTDAVANRTALAVTRTSAAEEVDVPATLAARREPRPPAAAYVPIVARVPVTIRAGTLADLPFIDRLQKAHGRALGFLPTVALEGKVRAGQVLVAEATGRDEGGGMRDEERRVEANRSSASSLRPHPSSLPVAYLIAADRYLKRDELGYVTQLCVIPEYRRTLVAAQLLQAQFDRSAYGCRLYSCWCAQDLKANEFWEGMGFAAIAFRAGGRGRGMRDEGGGMKVDGRSVSSLAPAPSSLSRPRVHIFWQKRIRAGDTSTPWWYPSQTGGGALRADRLVFPIPGGVHWRDVVPIEIGSGTTGAVHEGARRNTKKNRDEGAHMNDESNVSGGADVDERVSASVPAKRRKAVQAAPPPVLLRSPGLPGAFWFIEDGVPVEPVKPKAAKRKRVQFGPPGKYPADVAPAAEAVEAVEAVAKPSTKIDPALTALARELRDQWGERADQIVAPEAARHDVKRIATPTRAADVASDGMRLASPVAPEAETKQIERAA